MVNWVKYFGEINISLNVLVKMMCSCQDGVSDGVYIGLTEAVWRNVVFSKIRVVMGKWGFSHDHKIWHIQIKFSIFKHVRLFKVLLTSMEILHICKLWILLRKIVIYLVGRKFHLHRLFLLLKLTEVTSTKVSVKRFSYRQIPLELCNYIVSFVVVICCICDYVVDVLFVFV